MSEKRLAKQDGAKLVKNSGRGHMKGDAKLPPFLIDYKEYSSTFTIKKAAWLKHADDAWNQGHQEPLFSVELRDPNGKSIRLAVVDWNIFLDMLEDWDGKNAYGP